MDDNGKSTITRVGIDTGGTFTDIAWVDGNKLKSAKVPSRPDHPAEAVLEGLKFLDKQPDLICHGTTVGTNAVLAGQGGPSALVVTRGFADVLSIGRGDRSNLYSKTPSRPRPVIDRSRIFEIDARFDHNGNQLSFPTEEDYGRLLSEIESAKVKAIGIGLLHSATHPTGEKILAQILSQNTGLPTFASSGLAGYPREYERWSLASIAAYLAPVLGDYLSDLDNKCGSRLAIMTSSGGLVSTSCVLENPALCLLSGPAGGALGALAMGLKNVLALDMGGTSTDVSLLAGKIPRTHESEIDGIPIPLPTIDIHTIGAGGGSIITFDSGGMLSVGPSSAGADPGPACYGKGGPACLSDVALMSGRILSGMFLGGRMTLDEKEARYALDRILPRGMRFEQLLDSVIELAVVHLTGALRKISVARGIDPAPINRPDDAFVLLPFGGAGAIFAVECARALGLKQVVHPRASGVFSAIGLLKAPIASEKEKAVIMDAGACAESVHGIIQDLKSEVKSALSEWDDEGGALFSAVLECRYRGQTHALGIPVDEYAGSEEIIGTFEDAYRARFSYLHPATPVEIVTVRVRGEIPALEIEFDDIDPEGRDLERSLVGTVNLRTDSSWREGPVYRRELLPVDVEIKGPALIVEDFSTLYLPPDTKARLDSRGHILIEV